MARTEVRGGQIKDTSVQRDDLDVITSGQAVVRRIIAGTNVTLGSTGVDPGTGDVTINSVAGTGITRAIVTISSSGTLGATALTDYIYNATNNITLTLPTAVGNTNRYTIKNTGTGTIVINTVNSQTIDGEPAIAIRSQNNSVDLISDGNNWNII